MEPNFYRSPFGYYFPNRYRYMPRPNNSYNNYSRNNNAKSDSHDNNKFNPNNTETTPKVETRSERTDNPIFEIFGIKLYFDDILLVSLIFFLYNEGVKDQSLFIALILLLLS